MVVRGIIVLIGSISFMAIALTAPPAWAQPDELITPNQVETMLRMFIESPEGAKVGFKPGDSWLGIPPRECSAFVDPCFRCIRWGFNRVDPANHTVRMLGGKAIGTFERSGDGYVIKDAHKVKYDPNTIDYRAMILRYLSSKPEVAGIPPWVLESRTFVEKSRQCSSGPSPPDFQCEIGPWIVDPYGGTVILATKSDNLTATFEQEDEDYAIKNAIVSKAQRIDFDEAKTMLLQFIAKAEAEKYDSLITSTQKAVEDSSPPDTAINSSIAGPWMVDPLPRRHPLPRAIAGSLSIGPWKVDPVTHGVSLTTWGGATRYDHWYGMFVKEGDTYTLYMLWKTSAMA